MNLARIAYVVNVFPKLSETFIAGELAELRRRGVEIRILSLQRPTETLRHAIVERAGLLDRTVYEPDKFAGPMRDFRPQIIHAHFATEPAACARELAEELCVPFTFTAHGYDIHRRPPTDFAERAAAASAVITVSRANARCIGKKFDVERSHIRIIPCGIDTERFRPNRPIRNRRSENGPPLIVCVARLVPVKNLGLLLEACAELVSRRVNFRCVIVGDGKLRDELLSEHARLGLENAVKLFGPAEQDVVVDWWQQASVAVLTSEREGMPVSLMEAAACGVPAVATEVGGIPELVEDGITGLLVPAGNRDALVAALQQLLQNRDLAVQMGTQARERALRLFSIERQMNRLIEEWTRLIPAGAELCRSK